MDSIVNQSQTPTAFTNDLLDDLERFRGYQMLDGEEKLDLLQDTGILDYLVNDGAIGKFNQDEAFDFVLSVYTDDEDEKWSALAAHFIEHTPNVYYECDQVALAWPYDIAQAIYETHHSTGVDSKRELEDVLSGVRRYEEAQHNRAALTEVAAASRPPQAQDNDLATPEQALAARQAKYGRGM